MKVRITNNKIRYRLKEPEVALFAKSGFVTETLAFGNNDTEKLHFTLQASTAETIEVSFRNKHVVISVPELLAAEWTTTERVGFEAVIVNEKANAIAVLVEKDFMCLDGREEDNEGTYPNPLATTNS